MITECQVKNGALRVKSVPGSAYLSPKIWKKEIAKRSSSSPAAILKDKKLPPISPQRSSPQRSSPQPSHPQPSPPQPSPPQPSPVQLSPRQRSLPQRNVSVKPPNSNDDDATTTTVPSLDVTFHESSTQPQFISALHDTGQDVSMYGEGAENGVVERSALNSRHNSFLSIPLVTDHLSDSDKERHVAQER